MSTVPEFLTPDPEVAELEPLAPESLEAGTDTSSFPAVSSADSPDTRAAKLKALRQGRKKKASDTASVAEPRFRVPQSGVLGKIALVLSIAILAAFIGVGLHYGRVLGPSLLDILPLSQTAMIALLEIQVDFLQWMLGLTAGSFLIAGAGLLAAVWNRNPGTGIAALAIGFAAPFLGFLVFMVRGLLT